MSKKQTVLWQQCIRRIERLMLAALICVFSLFALADRQGLAKNPNNQARRAKQELLVVDGTVTILQSADEPEPVQKAVNDLARDLESVLGKRPKIVNRHEDAATITIVVGEQSKLPEALRPANLTGPESFSISVRLFR